MDELPKPNELLAARTSAETLFGLLRAWFDVPMSVTIDLRAVDSAVAELGEPQLVMAMAMRKLQALHLLTTPGVRTTTDVVLTVIQDLERALLQAPAMHLKRSAARTDWDAALAKLDDQLGGTGASDTSGTSGTPGNSDILGAARGPHLDEIELFRQHHGALHEAARAVLHASDGRIRILI